MRTTSNQAATLALNALATARLTRFLTTDWLGEWTLAGPAKKWARKYEAPAIQEHLRKHNLDPAEFDLEYSSHNPLTPQAKLVSALDCPFCVGFWIGLGILALDTATKETRLTGPWKGLKTALALNYVVGHASSRIDS